MVAVGSKVESTLLMLFDQSEPRVLLPPTVDAVAFSERVPLALSERSPPALWLPLRRPVAMA